LLSVSLEDFVKRYLSHLTKYRIFGDLNKEELKSDYADHAEKLYKLITEDLSIVLVDEAELREWLIEFQKRPPTVQETLILLRRILGEESE